MRVHVDRKQGHLPNGSIKIGVVAQRFRVSVDLLRLYEREGLLLSLKSAGGTRYFTEHDYAWIGTIIQVVRQARLNFAGIRHLLAITPCWKINNCSNIGKNGCQVIQDRTQPCWVNAGRCAIRPKDACGGEQDCYFCPVYRSAASNEDLNALLAKNRRIARGPQRAA